MSSICLKVHTVCLPGVDFYESAASPVLYISLQQVTSADARTVAALVPLLSTLCDTSTIQDTRQIENAGTARFLQIWLLKLPVNILMYIGVQIEMQIQTS